MKSSVTCWIAALVAAAILVKYGDCAKILAYLPFSAKSHYIVFNPVLKGLSDKGHQVTVFRTIPMDEPPKKNYKEVIIPNHMEQLQKTMNLNMVDFGKAGFIAQLMALNEIGLKVVEDSFKTDIFKQLLETKETYDLVITESFFAQCSTAALAHRFNAHLVVLMPIGNSHWTNFMTANPYSPSYIPDYNSFSTWDMNILERIQNTFVSIATILIQRLYYMPKFQEQTDKYFIYPGNETRPPLTQILSNVSLTLENAQVILNGAAPKAPNLLSIGALNIKPNKPLPPKLKKWLDEAKDGCIYFSYGTVVRGGHLDDAVKKAYVSAFSKIKQRVIWKIDEVVENMPSNVFTDSWMPQQDILAHPNVVLFITHGGYLSMNEAVHYGVPLIGTPFFGDQGKNMKEVVQSGYGLQLDYDDINEESVLQSIKEVIGNPRYKEVVKKKSAIYRDRQNSPVDTAVYWIEYVLRHSGAHHLRPHAANMPWYQAEHLDIAAIALVIVLITLLMLRKFYHFVTCQTWGKTKQKKKTS